MISRFLAVFAFTLGLASPVPSLAEPAILGTWQYDGFFFEGHRYPNPNPDLTLLFTFFGKNSSHLIWHRKGETKSCERRGIFEIREQFLYQKVTWVNPANAAECARDPDMQLNSETLSRFAVADRELHLYFDLNGKEFIYILRYCGPSGTHCLNPPENPGTSPNL